MKPSDIGFWIGAWSDRRAEIMLQKSADYGAEADALSAFKTLAALAGIHQIDIATPRGVAFFFMAHKLTRLANLLNPTHPAAQNESVEDTIFDLQNYADLLHLLLKENA